MTQYVNIEVDFINRTKLILQQYDNFTTIEEDSYEITLCLNCLMGLIVFPQQVWNGLVPDGFLNDEWFINKEYILNMEGIECGNALEYKIADFVRHIRNSISHGYTRPISLSGVSNNQITHLNFKDYNPRNRDLIFEAQIPVESLRKFAIKFADTMVSRKNNI